MCVLQLSAVVSEIEGSEEVRLKHICNKPLAPDNMNCNIQSVLNYWQNDESKLHASDAAMHAQKCIGWV